MPKPDLRLYEFCPFTNKPCPAEPGLRMLRRASVDRQGLRFRALEHLMLRLADNLFERFSDERIGGRALWADVVVEPLEVHVPTSLRPITADEYGVIVDGFHACMAKRCDELNPPPQTV